MQIRSIVRLMALILAAPSVAAPSLLDVSPTMERTATATIEGRAVAGPRTDTACGRFIEAVIKMARPPSVWDPVGVRSHFLAVAAGWYRKAYNLRAERNNQNPDKPFKHSYATDGFKPSLVGSNQFADVYLHLNGHGVSWMLATSGIPGVAQTGRNKSEENLAIDHKQLAEEQAKVAALRAAGDEAGAAKAAERAAECEAEIRGDHAGRHLGFVVKQRVRNEITEDQMRAELLNLLHDGYGDQVAAR